MNKQQIKQIALQMFEAGKNNYADDKAEELFEEYWKESKEYSAKYIKKPVTLKFKRKDGSISKIKATKIIRARNSSSIIRRSER